MNLFIYNYIADKLSGAIDKGYRKGIAGVVLLNKKEILRLADTPELFKISYTDVDRVALTNFKVEAFTVAGVMSYECEEKLKQLAVQLQEGKHPLAKGEKDIKKIWADEAYNILADYVDMPDMPPPRHLNTNLRTAMQSSYHAAQYIRLQDDSVRDLYPAYQYKTLDDVRVREAHRKLHDMIWANNDPVWDKIWPPNGWNCRCYIKPLNQEEALHSNVQPVTPPERVSDISREGRIGKDFERNPGQAKSIWDKWLTQKLTGVDYLKKFKESFEYARSINKKQVRDLLQAELDKNLEPLEPREPTAKNWDEDFPNNSVKTPIGQGVLAGDKEFESALEKVLAKKDNRSVYYGAFKKTMNSPTFILRESDRDGLVFVRAFTHNKKQVEIFAVAVDNKGLLTFKSLGIRNMDALVSKIKKGEVLHLAAFDNLAGLSRKHFSVGGDLLGPFTNIVKLSDSSKANSNTLAVLKNPNETWGETYNYNGVTNSEMHYIRYRVTGFELVKVNNDKPYEYREVDYSKIDEYRKGVLLYQTLQLPR